MFGIPLGLLLLMRVAEPVVKVVLGAVIIGFAIYRVMGRGGVELKDDRLAWLFGFGAGVLGGGWHNGPPLVAYGALRRWSPEQFRAQPSQGYFLPASVVGMAGYWLAGLWSASVTRYYLVSLPVVHRPLAESRLQLTPVEWGVWTFLIRVRSTPGLPNTHAGRSAKPGRETTAGSGQT